MPLDQLRNFHFHTARIADQIERTRQICARSLELLRQPVPSTFLGKRHEPLLGKDDQRNLRLEIADYLHSKEPQE